MAGDQPIPLRRFELELMQRLGPADPIASLKIIRFDGSRGLVRIPHRSVERARSAWNEAPGPTGLPLRTVRSYGTLRKGKAWMRGRDATNAHN